MNTDTQTFRRVLIDQTATHALEPTPGQMDSLCIHYELLCRWNPRVRLTGTVDPERAAVELFTDSLIAGRFVDGLKGEARADRRPLQIVDIGSGAGLPGIPVKITHPRWTLTIIDSSAKKVSFIKALIGRLGLSDIEVIRGRAEELARTEHLRGRFDVAFCRAVARPHTACKLALPFLKAGGSFIAQTAKPRVEELREALESALSTSITIGSTDRYSLHGTAGERMLIEIKKVHPTPHHRTGISKTTRKKPPV